MRDTLDLKLIADRTAQAHKRVRFSRILWLLLMIVCLIFAPIVFIFFIRYPTIAYLDQTGVHEAPSLSHYARDVQISPRGVVWLSTNNGQLLRLVDNEWQPISSPNPIYSFTLEDEIVWTASSTAVQRFENDSWTTYDNVGSDQEPISMVVGDGHVYVLDEQGNLWDFDGSEWHSANVRDFLPSLSDDENDEFGRLAYTSDGTLWLKWDELWRLRDGRWRSVNIGGTSTRYVAIAGVARNILWTNWGESLVRQDVVSGDFVIYDYRDMGVPAETRFYELATDTKITWVATTNGILRFDENTLMWDWYHVPDRPLVYSATITPNGTAWVIGGDDTSPIVPIVALVGLIITVVIIFVLFLISVIRRPKVNNDFDKQAREALYRVLPNLPQLQPISRKRRLESLFVILVIIGMFVLIVSLPTRQQFIAIPFAVVFIVAISFLFMWRGQMRTEPSFGDSIRYLLPNFMWLLWVVVAQVLLLAVADLRIFSNRFANEFFIVILSFVMILIVPVGLYYLLIKWCYTSPISRGDYETALRRMRMMIRWQPKRAAFQRGEVILLANSNQLDEAELKAQEALYNFPYDFIHLSFMLDILAGIWMERGRCDEALALSEPALLLQINRLTKGNAGAWSNLAENYMRCGDDSARALEITEYAEKCGRASSTLLGIQAWALAAQGINSRAEITLGKAHKKIVKSFKRMLTADWHLYAGRVYQTQGKNDEAQKHYRQAIEMDPHGHVGYQAQETLKTVL